MSPKGVFAGCGATDDIFPMEGVTKAVIERPQIYRASMSKGDPNDIVTLAIRAGRYQERLQARGVQVTLVLPAQWKGQVPKDIHHGRILASFPDDQKIRVLAALDKVARGQRHDTLDGIGLALWLFRSGK